MAGATDGLQAEARSDASDQSAIATPPDYVEERWRRLAVGEHPFPEHPEEDARRGFERALAQIRGELDGLEVRP